MASKTTRIKIHFQVVGGYFPGDESLLTLKHSNLLGILQVM